MIGEIIEESLTDCSWCCMRNKHPSLLGDRNQNNIEHTIASLL